MKISNKYLKTKKGENKLVLWDLKTFYKATIILSLFEAQKSMDTSMLE